jgi:hypothetical protein
MFPDHLERLSYFVLQTTEVRGQRRAFRIDHHIHGNIGREATQSNRLAQAASDSISLHRSAQSLANREANSRALQLAFRSTQVKNRHVRCKMPSPLLVDSFKVRMPQQAIYLWNSALRFSLGRLIHFHSCPGRERPSPKKTGLKQVPSREQTEGYAYLFTKSGFHGNALAPFGSAPGNDRASALGLHTGPEAVHLRSAAAVRLECTFRHEKSLVLLSLADALLKLVKGKYK